MKLSDLGVSQANIDLIMGAKRKGKKANSSKAKGVKANVVKKGDTK